MSYYGITRYLKTAYQLDVVEEDILTIIKNPANLHGHGRRDDPAGFILPHMKRQFWAQQLMPNVAVPEVGMKSDGLTSIDKLLWYRDHIFEKCGRDERFLPIFSLYLSESLPVVDIKRAVEENLIGNVKYYPKGGTTNSGDGLGNLAPVRAQLEYMSDSGVRFSLHGETPTSDGKTCVHRDKREPVFYSSEGESLLKWYRGPVIAEHISTGIGAQFVKSYPNVYATVTPQHMLFNNDAIFHKMKVDGDWYFPEIAMGLRPSMVCMPVLKHPEELEAIWDLLSWQYNTQARKVFLGDDTAWHPAEKKYIEGCACGVFNSPVSLEMYYMAFKMLDAKFTPGILSDFQRFTSDIGLGVYGIQPSKTYKRIAIVRTPNQVADQYHGAVPPFAGEILPWKAFDITNAYD